MKKAIKLSVAALILLIAGGIVLSRVAAKPDAPRQPIEFDHWLHVSSKDSEAPGLECTFCHEHVDKSAHATIPNVDTCMSCHQAVRTESPEIQKLAAFADKKEQPPWKRVYWFESEANVFFSHKPHTRAGVECAACHGDVGQSHRVRREVNQTMGWCIDCHRQRNVSVDCYICHR